MKKKKKKKKRVSGIYQKKKIWDSWFIYIFILQLYIFNIKDRYSLIDLFFFVFLTFCLKKSKAKIIKMPI